MLVSPLRCFKVSSLTTPPLIWGGARRAEGMSILISPLGRTIITYLAFARTIATKFQSFKVSRIKDACFTASLFQGFITHNSSPNLGRCPQGRGDVNSYLACAQTIATYLPFGSNDCYKVSKFHASKMLVSSLRCFKVSSLTTPPLIWGGARRAEGMSILISPLGRTIITYLPFGSNDYSQANFQNSKLA